MNKIKKGDEVQVIAGRDKGKRGIVEKVLSNDRVIVEGVNTVKKCVKATQNDKGGIVIKTLSIHRSNVMLYDTTSEKAGRVGIRILADGRKVRYFKATNQVIDV